jgi:hypothetical protein
MLSFVWKLLGTSLLLVPGLFAPKHEHGQRHAPRPAGAGRVAALPPLPGAVKQAQPEPSAEALAPEDSISVPAPTSSADAPDEDPALTPTSSAPDVDVSVPGKKKNPPATRYARMSRAQCISEAKARGLPVQVIETARGVLAPVRITGALHGVLFHSAISEAARKTSVFEIFDCRLVLALDDATTTLKKYDIVEVIHMSAYRPPAAKLWKDGAIGTRHTGALALDAGTFIKSDGSKFNVEKDFHGQIGQHPCTYPPKPGTPESVTFRKLSCELIASELFHVFLTPGFNWEHRNHFHMEVSAGGTHFYVR